MAARLTLIFPDGSAVSGETFRELEDAMRASQWQAFKTRRAFRQEMRKRAAIWSGIRKSKPIVHQTSRAFIYQLANSGMCMLDVHHPTTQDEGNTR